MTDNNRYIGEGEYVWDTKAGKWVPNPKHQPDFIKMFESIINQDKK